MLNVKRSILLSERAWIECENILQAKVSAYIGVAGSVVAKTSKVSVKKMTALGSKTMVSRCSMLPRFDGLQKFTVYVLPFHITLKIYASLFEDCR